jgi:hypothetical protein
MILISKGNSCIFLYIQVNKFRKFAQTYVESLVTPQGGLDDAEELRQKVEKSMRRETEVI